MGMMLADVTVSDTITGGSTTGVTVIEGTITSESPADNKQVVLPLHVTKTQLEPTPVVAIARPRVPPYQPDGALAALLAYLGLAQHRQTFDEHEFDLESLRISATDDLEEIGLSPTVAIMIVAAVSTTQPELAPNTVTSADVWLMLGGGYQLGPDARSRFLAGGMLRTEEHGSPTREQFKSLTDWVVVQRHSWLRKHSMASPLHVMAAARPSRFAPLLGLPSMPIGDTNLVTMMHEGTNGAETAIGGQPLRRIAQRWRRGRQRRRRGLSGRTPKGTRCREGMIGGGGPMHPKSPSVSDEVRTVRRAASQTIDAEALRVRATAAMALIAGLSAACGTTGVTQAAVAPHGEAATLAFDGTTDWASVMNVGVTGTNADVTVTSHVETIPPVSHGANRTPPSAAAPTCYHDLTALFEHVVAGDGHCCYHSVIAGLHLSASVDDLRRAVVSSVDSKTAPTKGQRLARKHAKFGIGKQTCTAAGWGGDHELEILAGLYNATFYVREDITTPGMIQGEQWIEIGRGDARSCYLIHRGGNHFNALLVSSLHAETSSQHQQQSPPAPRVRSDQDTGVKSGTRGVSRGAGVTSSGRRVKVKRQIVDSMPTDAGLRRARRESAVTDDGVCISTQVVNRTPAARAPDILPEPEQEAEPERGGSPAAELRARPPDGSVEPARSTLGPPTSSEPMFFWIMATDPGLSTTAPYRALAQHPDVARLIANDPQVLTSAAIVGRAVITRVGDTTPIDRQPTQRPVASTGVGARAAPAALTARHLEISELRMVRVGKPVVAIAGSLYLGPSVTAPCWNSREAVDAAICHIQSLRPEGSHSHDGGAASVVGSSAVDVAMALAQQQARAQTLQQRKRASDALKQAEAEAREHAGASQKRLIIAGLVAQLNQFEGRPVEAQRDSADVPTLEDVCHVASVRLAAALVAEFGPDRRDFAKYIASLAGDATESDVAAVDVHCKHWKFLRGLTDDEYEALQAIRQQVWNEQRRATAEGKKPWDGRARAKYCKDFLDVLGKEDDNVRVYSNVWKKYTKKWEWTFRGRGKDDAGESVCVTYPKELGNLDHPVWSFDAKTIGLFMPSVGGMIVDAQRLVDGVLPTDLNHCLCLFMPAVHANKVRKAFNTKCVTLVAAHQSTPARPKRPRGPVARQRALQEPMEAVQAVCMVSRPWRALCTVNRCECMRWCVGGCAPH